VGRGITWSDARGIAAKASVYLRDEISIATAMQIFKSGNIPQDIKEAVYLAVAIQDMNALNTSDVSSLVALAQVSTNDIMCDFVGTKLKSFTDVTSIAMVLTAAFNEGLCQPKGVLWDLVIQYRMTVFSGAFDSQSAIQAISDLSFLSPKQKQNQIALIEQNILFCKNS